jgi:hypothetical protein
MKPVFKYKGYNVYISDKPQKKYYAIVNDRKVYFGQLPYQQYHDKIGYYSDLNHSSRKRRELYRARQGARGYQNRKGSASWFAWNLLW